MGWSGAFGTLTLANFIAWVTGNRPAGFGDIVMLAGIASLPLLPIVGFHLNQARRQFLAGHTLADLRSALEIARREQRETESLTREHEESSARKLLRVGTIVSASWLAVTFGLLLAGVIHENQNGVLIFGISKGMALILGPVLTTMLLGAVSNALDVQFIPTAIRDRWQTGIRDRLWNSKVGKWLAKRLGAPEQSRAVGGGVFRATEVALGAAVSDLYAALPSAFRDNLAELPATVDALEASAAAARAELDIVSALAPSGSSDAGVLERRRSAATAHLSASVAALEGIRLDLLRLHGGANDLAPLTTLIEKARLAGDDVKRLADAQREVDESMGRVQPTSTRLTSP